MPKEYHTPSQMSLFSDADYIEIGQLSLFDAPPIAHETTRRKTCRKCGERKPIDDFYKDSAGRDGHLAQCKKCIIATSTQYHADHYERTRKPLPLTPTGMICRVCKVDKPLTEFQPRRVNQFHTHCKACSAAMQRERDRRNGAKPRYPENLPSPVNGGRVCMKCFAEKPLERFIPDKRSEGGYLNMCKDCRNTTEREAYADGGKEQKLTYNRAWYEANKGYHAALSKAWREENRLKANEYGKRRYALKKGVTIEKVDYEQALQESNGICYICNKEMLPHHKIEFDHVIPLHRQGPHSQENVRATHQVCNRRKCDNLLEEMSDHQRRGPTE